MFKIVLAALCLAALVPLEAAAQQPAKVKMALAARAMNYAPYLAAIEKGYFKEEGLDVEIVDAAGGVATPAQISGDIDFNTSASSALSAMLRGAPLRIIYYPWDKTIYQIWAMSPDVKTLEDIKGKAVGVQSRGDTFELGVRIVLQNAGIDPNSVIYTAVGVNNTRRAAMVAGSLPVSIITPEDVDWMKINNLLGTWHMIYNLYPSVGMPLAGTAVRVSDLEKNRDRVTRFMRAVQKGFLYTLAFRPQSVDVVAKFNNNLSKESLDSTYNDTIVTRTEDGSISEDLQRQEATLRAELIQFPKDKVPPLDKLYDFSIAKAVWSELQTQGWKPTP